eukprot:CAMPEP_0181338910 /NCGR_PEP_ID=MMETSP1101-20121128/28920_1 /TAXON_ID=46948 /ORGANISM="Rhodomonas abbreviata, Strain Caron Lab Isolate" /LENGTH=258 /DNA_ID=CAMNT_0023449735 /DNA_START=378 /DNA_END=1155 /DNA_ORIENTATION=-
MPKKIDVPVEEPGTKKLVGVFIIVPWRANNDKRIVDGRERGKHFSAGSYKTDEKTRLCAPGTFKLLPFLFADEKKHEPFRENLRYKDIFSKGDPRPRGINGKLGFLSTDFPKRDEYTNTIRTEQLREVLKKEHHMNIHRMRDVDTRLRASGHQRPTSAVQGQGVGLQKMPLYDLVFRLPEQDLKHKRDDRQGRFFFMGMREKQKAAGAYAPGVWRERVSSQVEGHAWVNVGMPSGNVVQVLVDENKKVLAKRPMSAHV